MIRDLSWYLILLCPVSAVGILWHTVAALQVALLVFIGIGWIVPIVYQLFRFRQRGEDYYRSRAVAHVVIWPSLIVFLTLFCWCLLNGWQALYQDSYILFVLAALVCMISFVILAAFAVEGAVWCYRYLKGKSDFIRYWLTTAFLSGVIPFSVIVALLPVMWYQMNMMAPFMLIFFLAAVLKQIFVIKLVLVMGIFAFYFYFALTGVRKKRFVQTVVSALFYVALVFLPSVIFHYLPVDSPFLMVADPLLLLTVPVLSDLCLCGLSIYGGEKVVAVFFDGE